jgi:hypothetical protein
MLIENLLRYLGHLAERPHQAHSDDSRYIWLLKNMDFERWQSNPKSPSLGVSAPREIGLGPYLASIDKLLLVSLESRKDSDLTLLVQFSCSLDYVNQVLPLFMLSFFQQTARHLFSSQVRQKALEKTFLHALLQAGFPQVSHSRQHHSLESYLSAILDEVKGRRLLEPLKKALDGNLRSWTIILVVENIHCLLPPSKASGFIRDIRKFCEWLEEQCHTLKVLYLTDRRSDVEATLEDIPWIEYDEERKGESIDYVTMRLSTNLLP